jgi:hypothetical protein
MQITQELTTLYIQTRGIGRHCCGNTRSKLFSLIVSPWFNGSGLYIFYAQIKEVYQR